MTLSRRALLAAGLSAPLLAPLFARGASAAPSSDLIDAHWFQFGDAEMDHAPWTDFLTRYRRSHSDGVARVNYRAVRPADRVALKIYLADLQASKPTSFTRDAAFAYWANLYNALTVDLILEAYPVDSIREVEGGLFNTGPWSEDVAKVEGRTLSLDDIEHGVLRPVFGDPRVHYAVNCASIGCPNLPERAFTSMNLDRRLDQLAVAYVNHPRGARIDEDRLIVSSIYVWFEEDFGGDEAGVIAHLRRYAKPELAAGLTRISDIYDDEYDWRLNDIK